MCPAGPPAVATGTWNGSSEICGENRPRGHRDRFGHRRTLRPKRVRAEFARRMAFFDVDDASRRVGRPDGVHRPERLARRPAAMMRSTLSGRVGAAMDPCAAIQVIVRAWPTGEEREIDLSARRGRGSTKRRASWTLPGRGGRAARSKRCGSTGPHARRGARRDTGPALDTAGERLARLPDAWRAASGRAAAYYQAGGAFGYPRPVAGRDGAHPRRAAILREHLLRAHRVSSGRRRAALGGIHPAVEACARTARTITSGCRWRRAATSRPRATLEVLDEQFTSSKAAP